MSSRLRWIIRPPGRQSAARRESTGQSVLCPARDPRSGDPRKDWRKSLRIIARFVPPGKSPPASRRAAALFDTPQRMAAARIVSPAGASAQRRVTSWLIASNSAHRRPPENRCAREDVQPTVFQHDDRRTPRWMDGSGRSGDSTVGGRELPASRAVYGHEVRR